jgi:hypothetical protein
MPDNVQTEGPPNMAALVGGIIGDAQQLIRQEITLARSELQQEWNKIKTATVSMAAGGLVALVGVFLLAWGVVHLLHWASGQPDPATVPLWGWFLIVGAVFAAVGGGLLYRGVSKAGEVQVPPQTVDSLKEIL